MAEKDSNNILHCLLAVLLYFAMLLLTFCMITNYCGDPYIWWLKLKFKYFHNAEVLDMWWHQDVGAEEVSVKLALENGDTIVLEYISADVYNYPYDVYIGQINDLTFFSGKLFFTSNVNVGTNSIIGEKIGMEFNNIKAVLSKVSELYSFFDTFMRFPYVYCFTNNGDTTLFFIVESESPSSDSMHEAFFESLWIPDSTKNRICKNEIGKIDSLYSFQDLLILSADKK